jgi:hypothetical protein
VALDFSFLLIIFGLIYYYCIGFFFGAVVSYAVYLMENKQIMIVSLIENESHVLFFFVPGPSSFRIFVVACVESFIHLREREKQNGGICSIYIKCTWWRTLI